MMWFRYLDKTLRRLTATALLLCGTLFTVSAAGPAETGTVVPPDTLFRKAGQAYDDGDIAQAVDDYRQLVNRDYAASPLYFNLGNALFRQGQFGEAILNYLRAQRLNPRSNDIKANLQFALEQSGAVVPAPNIFIRYLRQLRFAEWIAVATALYWMAAAVIAFYMLTLKSAPLIRRTLITILVVFVIACCGIADGISRRLHPVAVIVEPDRKARFAPLEGSTVHFEVPEGSIVRVIDQQDTWLRISAGRQKGWVPQTACAPVLPTDPADQ